MLSVTSIIKILLPVTNVSCFLFYTRSGGDQAGQSLSVVLLYHAQFLKPTPELESWEF